MQARIDRIGNSLVPAYQKSLPESDLTRIIFRFQLVDEPAWQDALTMPSGVILVPRQIVERLTDDTQLATVLADNIATALEKQSFRILTVTEVSKATGVATLASAFLFPPVGLVTGVISETSGGMAAARERHNLEQSGRVSLTLLADAGYDIHQAPLVWWQLYTKQPFKPTGRPLPTRAANLYQIIGIAWRNPPQPTLKSR